MTPREALEKCVTLAGGQSALARRIGGKVKQAHVHYWLNEMKQISHLHVIACEEAVERRITRHQLRPDIYPNPEDGKPVARRPKSSSRAAA